MSKPQHRVLKTIGRFLARIPYHSPLLFPFYNAHHVRTLAHTFSFPTFPEALNGFRVTFVSDIHYGPYFSDKECARLISQIDQTHPDMIILGGDYGEDTETAIRFFESIPKINSTKLIFAAIGNHDLKGSSSDYQTMIASMKRNGILPLVNQLITVFKNGNAIDIASTDNDLKGSPDFSTIIHAQEKNQEPRFTIYFPHSPDILPEAMSTHGFDFDLALCGHTHGGQVAVFGHSILTSSRYRDRYRSGVYTENGRTILISNGVGTSIVPVRIGAPAQIHQITLFSHRDGFLGIHEFSLH